MQSSIQLDQENAELHRQINNLTSQRALLAEQLSKKEALLASAYQTTEQQGGYIRSLEGNLEWFKTQNQRLITELTNLRAELYRLRGF